MIKASRQVYAASRQVYASRVDVQDASDLDKERSLQSLTLCHLANIHPPSTASLAAQTKVHTRTPSACYAVALRLPQRHHTAQQPATTPYGPISASDIPCFADNHQNEIHRSRSTLFGNCTCSLRGCMASAFMSVEIVQSVLELQEVWAGRRSKKVAERAKLTI